MDNLQKGVVILVKSALTGKAYPLPDDFSIDEAFDFIMKHRIMMLAYDGAVRCGISASEPAMKKLFQLYIRCMMHSENQMRKIGEIYAAFDENGIDYLPLKGCNMKALYPKPELRVMGDADILIRKGQYENIKPVLEKLGFSEGEHYKHQYDWDTPELHLEIHGMPVQEDYEKFYAYYGDGWSRGIKTETNRYVYSPEDEFIYALVHFAKHYLAGGIGIRHAADIFVFLEKFPGMDFGYIENELEKLGILEFYKNIRRMLDSWFRDGETDDITETISEFILQSGNWGTFESAAVASEIRENSGSDTSDSVKTKFLLREAFPSFEEMKNRYPVLEKNPVLLPALWIARLGNAVLFRRKNLAVKMKRMETISDEKVDAHRKNLEKAGFRF